MNIQRLFSLAAPAALTGVAGCLVDDPLPYAGECAVHPEEGAFEYGQIGIGTCLASPADIQVRPDPADATNEILWIVNSNARGTFQGSSVLAIDLASVDLSCPAQGLHEVETDALAVQEFAGRIAFEPDSGLALLGSRQRAGAEGDLTDVLYFIDASDPRDLRHSDRGPRSFGPYRWMQVPSDPWSVRIGPDDGRAYVLGLTTHTVSALDLRADPAQYLDLVGERHVSSASFEDVDASGSDPDWNLLSTQPALLQDEVIHVTALGGTTRLFGAGDDGALYAWDAVDARSFTPIAGGPVADEWESWAEGGLSSATVALDDGALRALAAGWDGTGQRSIGRLTASTVATSWSQGDLVLAAASAWEGGDIADPDWFTNEGVDFLYYSGGPAGARSIGHARGNNLDDFRRQGPDPTAEGLVFTAAGSGWDSASVYAPAAIQRADTGAFLLYYSGHDGDGDDVPQGIGLAASTDGLTFVRSSAGVGGTSLVLEPGPPGAWDGVALGFPSILYADGRFHLYYQGFDGAVWRTGHATSFDGVSWDRDPANPVLDGGSSPAPVRAVRVSPSGSWRVEGERSGPVLAHATSGSAFSGSGSPLQFNIVDGHWIGAGEPGESDEDGALDPAALLGDRLYYVGDDGASRRLHEALVDGGRIERLGARHFRGFEGAVPGLDGDSPSERIRQPSAATDGVVTLLAAESSRGVVLGSIASDGGIDALGTGLALPLGAAGAIDDARAGAPSLLFHDGQWLLFYEADDGSTTRIALATSADGLTWTREGTVLDRGPAGAWDDARVGRPSVLWDDDASAFRLWYVGNDGQDARIGYAESADGRTWERYRDASGSSLPVFDGSSVSFSDGRVDMPAVNAVSDGFEMWFGAPLEGRYRIGRARSADGVNWTVLPNVATAGDRFTINVEAGDTDESSAIQLGDDRNAPRYVEGYAVHGAGATEMILSPDGGMAIVANKRAPFLLVLDLRDDSAPGFDDANAFDIEAMIRLPQRAGMVGARDLVFSPDGEDLWVVLGPLVAPETAEDDIRRGPEAIVRVPWSVVGDGDQSRAILDDVITTWAPLPRGVEEDEGYTTDISGGPTSLTLSADGRWAYITNFNQNSVSILDLDAGARPVTRLSIQGLDESPFDSALSHGGTVLWVANSYGVQRDGAQHSTVHAIDVDPQSPRYGEVLTTLSNLESRSSHGCP